MHGSAVCGHADHAVRSQANNLRAWRAWCKRWAAINISSQTQLMKHRSWQPACASSVSMNAVTVLGLRDRSGGLESNRENHSLPIT